MRIRTLEGLLLVTALALAVPRAAHACGRGNNYGGLQAILYGAAVVGSADVVMTLWDSATVLGVAAPSSGYGAFELVVSVPQLVIGIAGMTSASGSSSGFFAGYTIWMAALTAHGIWSISQAGSRAAAPVPAPDGGDETEPPPADTPGLQLSIGTTFVPVGQFSYPGFGLVGRF